MSGGGGKLEMVKLVLISLALVFGISAFAMELLRTEEQPVRTLKLPDPPPPPPLIDPDEAAVRLERMQREEALRQEIEELEDRQKRADEAVAAVRGKYEVNGKLPDRIVLETPTDRPVPTSQDQEAIPVSAPLEVYPHEKRIEFDACVVLDKGTVMEVLIAGPRGKLHESLLQTYINPYDLWLALALLGLKQSYTARGQYDMVDLEGDRVVMEVAYDGPDGKPVRRRIEDLVYHFGLNSHMPYEGWVYVGSHFVQTRDGQVFLIAEKTENLVTTWHWPTVILDNPLKEGGDDTLYRPYEGVVPPRGTKMRVIVTPDQQYNAGRAQARPLTGR